MQIYLLLIIFITLTIISYMLLKGDILNPCFVVPFVFFVSTLFAIYNIAHWDIKLSTSTVGLLGGGVAIYVLTGFVVYYGTQSARKSSKEYHNIDYIKVANLQYNVLLFFEILSTMLFVREKIKIVGGSITNLAAWSMMQSRYKYLTHFTQEREGVGGIVIQMYQAVTVIGLIFSYILVNNYIAEKKIEKKHIIPVVVYLVSIIFEGNRLPFLRWVFFMIVVFFVLWRRKNGWNKTIKIKTIIRLILIMVAVLAIFVGIRYLVGRSQEKTAFYSFTEYAGGSIQLFDLYVKNPTRNSNIFGYRTLYNINDLFGRLTHNSELNYLYAYEFRKSNGIDIGNVYTGFRAFYEDFGTIGMFICIVLHSTLFTYLYTRIKIRSIRKKVFIYDLPLILFARISYGYFFMSISFYSDYLSSTFVKIIIFFVMIIYFLKMKFSINGHTHMRKMKQVR